MSDDDKEPQFLFEDDGEDYSPSWIVYTGLIVLAWILFGVYVWVTW